jgi:hypothetical protein
LLESRLEEKDMERTAPNKDWFAKLVAKEVEYADPYEDRGLSIGIVAVGLILTLYFILHQVQLTGFFTASFGIFEMILFYGTLLYWIVTSVLIIIGQKNMSRDLDLWALFLTAFAVIWLLILFPYDFALFAKVLPDSLTFLLQWISNDLARVFMVFSFLVHLGFAVFSAVLRIAVYKARAPKNS